MKRYYFDWAATAFDGANGAASYAALQFANPSSRHCEGRAAKAALEDARKRAAAALGVEPEQLYWTSGASEANAIALFSLLRAKSAGRGLLFGAAEHPSVRENALILKELGVPAAQVPLEEYGAPSPQTLQKSLKKHPNTSFIAIMHIQNEVGAIADIAALVHAAKAFSLEASRRPVHFHCDMAQSLGKAPFSLRDFDVDSAAFSAHKTGGPRGTGLLYLKKPIIPLVFGGGQERGIRSGTENVEAAVRFSAALEGAIFSANKAHEAQLKLINGLLDIERCSLVPRCRAEAWAADAADAADAPRFSPFIVQAAFSGIAGEVMTRALDDAGFAVSTGSACSVSKNKRPVLEAMGVDSKTAFEAIRISTSHSTTCADVDALLLALQEICKKF